MYWNDDVTFEDYTRKVDEWYSNEECFLGDPPIEPQFALDLIFKTLIDDKEHYEYLTTMSESVEQTNCLMLEMILQRYSREYRKYLKNLIKRGKQK